MGDKTTDNNAFQKREQRWAERRYVIADREVMSIVNGKDQEDEVPENKTVVQKDATKERVSITKRIKAFMVTLHREEFFGTMFGVLIACGFWMWSIDHKIDAACMIVSAILFRLAVEYFYEG